MEKIKLTAHKAPGTEEIVFNMTWRGAAPLLALVLMDGGPEGQEKAKAELARMASLADRAREFAELVAKVREALRPVAEMHKADPNYVTRADAVDAIAEAFALVTGTTD